MSWQRGWALKTGICKEAKHTRARQTLHPMNLAWWLEGKKAHWASVPPARAQNSTKTPSLLGWTKGHFSSTLPPPFSPCCRFSLWWTQSLQTETSWPAGRRGSAPPTCCLSKVPAQELDFPQYRECVWTSQFRSSEDPEFGFQKSFLKQFLVLNQPFKVKDPGCRW